MIFPSRTEIITAMKNKICYKSADLIGGSILMNGSRVNMRCGGYATVFPFTKSDGVKIAVRCWFADIGDSKKRMLVINSYLGKLNAQYFVNFNFHERALLVNGDFHPVLTMDWVELPDLKEYVNNNINSKHKILVVAENFKSMVSFFHSRNLSHGDLSHGNIKVGENGQLLVIDYDSMYVEGLEDMPDVIKGLPGYQHPKRRDVKTLNCKLDYFSELVIYLSLLIYAENPQIWEQFYETEDFLFSNYDFTNPNSSNLLNTYKSSSNKLISSLTNKLIDYLGVDDILKLEPLEDIINAIKFDEIAGDIIDKF